MWNLSGGKKKRNLLTQLFAVRTVAAGVERGGFWTLGKCFEMPWSHLFSGRWLITSSVIAVIVSAKGFEIISGKHLWVMQPLKAIKSD